jgi:serine/threonine protein phosphatase 1
MHNDKKKSRLLVISDIHGHTDGLMMLLREAAYLASADRLILLGDYIDSDPQTLSTLLTVKKLVEEGARALPGNKETALIRDAVELRQRGTAGAPGPLEILQTSTNYSEIMAWLKSLPLFIEEESYLLVHAGIRPGVPMIKQSAIDLTEIREEFWNVPGMKLDRTVIFGHTPTFKLGTSHGRLWFGNNKIGIDTGAKHGCRLTLFDVYDRLSYSCSTALDNMYGDYRLERI